MSQGATFLSCCEQFWVSSYLHQGWWKIGGKCFHWIKSSNFWIMGTSMDRLWWNWISYNFLHCFHYWCVLRFVASWNNTCFPCISFSGGLLLMIDCWWSIYLLRKGVFCLLVQLLAIHGLYILLSSIAICATFDFFFKYCSGLEIVDAAARCFNCGSYSHALRECPRPRDHVAVNNARKQHKSRRNQNPSRNPTRYYQNTPAGKYDDLRPGALDDVTRKLLGLGVRVIENAVLMF